MRYLQDIFFSRSEFGYQLEIRLADSWKDVAQIFPKERIGEILKQELLLSQQTLDDARMMQKIQLTTGEYGLHHISLTPDRAGLDLFSAQNSYISHNLTRAVQVSALLPIILRYIKDLEYIKHP